MTKRPKAAKVAGKKANAHNGVTVPDDDAVLAQALSLRAEQLRQSDDSCRKAASIVEWAATASGKRLRDLVLAFKDRQENALTLEQVLGQVPLVKTQGQYEADLERATARWKADVLEDGAGKPLKIDAVEYIDRMSYWIATAKQPSEWLRKKGAQRAKHLKRVRAVALELASLIEEGSGPGWPPAIELFDDSNLPKWDGEHQPLAHYRSRVSDPLKRQQLPEVLRNLAAATDRQARMDKLALRDVPRPTTVRDGQAMIQRAEWWFKNQCRLSVTPVQLIEDLITAPMPPKSRHVIDVKERLRPPRKRKARPLPVK